MSTLLTASTHVAIRDVTADSIDVRLDNLGARIVIADSPGSVTVIFASGRSDRDKLTELTRIGRAVAEQAADLLASLPEPRDVDRDTAEVSEALAEVEDAIAEHRAATRDAEAEALT